MHPITYDVPLTHNNAHVFSEGRVRGRPPHSHTPHSAHTPTKWAHSLRRASWKKRGSLPNYSMNSLSKHGSSAVRRRTAWPLPSAPLLWLPSLPLNQPWCVSPPHLPLWIKAYDSVSNGGRYATPHFGEWRGGGSSCVHSKKWCALPLHPHTHTPDLNSLRRQKGGKEVFLLPWIFLPLFLCGGVLGSFMDTITLFFWDFYGRTWKWNNEKQKVRQ